VETLPVPKPLQSKSGPPTTLMFTDVAVPKPA